MLFSIQGLGYLYKGIITLRCSPFTQKSLKECTCVPGPKVWGFQLGLKNALSICHIFNVNQLWVAHSLDKRRMKTCDPIRINGLLAYFVPRAE